MSARRLAGLMLVVPGLAVAQPVTTGGDLELEISGDSTFDIEYVDEDFDEGADGRREWFFNQDHEVRFRATGSSDATDLEYGVNIELELDTGGGTNAQFDEAWTFIRGNWGEFRLGDEDAPAEDFSFTPEVVAAGTGGVDSDLRTSPAYVVEDSGEATKIIYYTPGRFGLSGGLSYGVNADDRGSTAGSNTEASDIINAAVNYERAIGDVTIGASAAMIYASLPQGAADDSAINFAFGGLVEAFGVGLAAYYGNENNDFAADSLDGNPRESFFSVGVGGTIFGNVDISFNFQNDFFDGGDNTKLSYIGGVSVPIAPGVAVHSDLILS